MEVIYVIEIVVLDDNCYRENVYFKGLTVDQYGIVRIDTTKDPLSAKHFYSVDKERKSSVINVIKNSLKPISITTKRFTYNLTE